MFKRFVLAWAVFFALAPRASAAGYQPEARFGDMAQHILVNDNPQREFYYHLPKGYSGAPTPIVFFFHGGGGHALSFASDIHLVERSNENNFIGIAPQAINSHWNYGVKDQARGNYEDVRFVNQMIEYMQNNYNIDRRRIYIAGYSDGGWFTQWLTYQIPEKIAAAGVVCALETIESQQTFGYSHPRLPVVFMLGTRDPRMSWSALYTINHTSEIPIGYTPQGIPEELTPNKTEVIGADATVQSWVRADRCLIPGRLELFPNVCGDDHSQVEATFYRGNDDSRDDVAFYKVIGGGHTWPGAVRRTSPYGPVNEDIDATQQIWNFFNAHPKRLLNEPQPFPRLTVAK